MRILQQYSQCHKAKILVYALYSGDHIKYRPFVQIAKHPTKFRTFDRSDTTPKLHRFCSAVCFSLIFCNLAKTIVQMIKQIVVGCSCKCEPHKFVPLSLQ